MNRNRTAFRGTAIVAAGAVLVALSLVLDWAEPDIGASESHVAVVLLPIALGTLALTAIVRARTATWPFVYTRVLGACALVATAWAVFEQAREVKAGVLIAALGAAMIVSGSSAALSPEAKTTARLPPDR